jgi:transposase-like protein
VLNGGGVGAWRISSGLWETEQAGSGIAEIARQFEISRGLLWNWRNLVRRGALRPEPRTVFVPMQVISEPSTAERRSFRRKDREAPPPPESGPWLTLWRYRRHLA